MKKQGKANAAAVAADKGKGKKSAKSKAGILRFTVGGLVYAVSDSASDTELLRAVVFGVCRLSEQLEVLRRTLWRMSEIREYESKGANGKPEKGGNAKANRKPETAEGGEK